MRTIIGETGNRRNLPLISLVCVLTMVLMACGGETAPATTEGGSAEPAPATTSQSLPATTEATQDTAEDEEGYVNPGVGLEERDAEHLPADWDAVVAAAAEEGEVVVFTNHAQNITDPIIAAFGEAFPDITVNQVRDSVDVLPTRYVQEREALGSSPADLLESSLFETMVSENPEWFLPVAELDPGHIPTLNDLLPAAMTEDAPYSVSSATYVWSFVYNTEAVDESDLPSEWCELSDPMWAGRGQMADPRAATTYNAFQYFLLSECGADFTSALMDNGWELSDAVAPIGEQVVAGAFDVGFPLARAHTMNAREAGAPIAHLDLQPNRLGKTSMMFPADPPNPNAARVFATFILSAQAQELQCTFGNLSSFNTKVEGDCADMPISPDAEPLNLNISDEQSAELLEVMGLE